jgi:hypothetical protein
MNQFWRVLAVMAGDCNIYSLPTKNGNKNYLYDPLLNENYNCSCSIPRKVVASASYLEGYLQQQSNEHPRE